MGAKYVQELQKFAQNVIIIIINFIMYFYIYLIKYFKIDSDISNCLEECPTGYVKSEN